MYESVLDELNEFSLHELPRLNRNILLGTSPLAELVHGLNRGVLCKLPAAEHLSPIQARQAVVHLGLFGASIARHFQELNRADTGSPDEAFAPLVVGAGNVSFLDYFSSLAERTQTGHPPRDAYASLVRWNAPTTTVYCGGGVLAELRGAFDDGKVRTYTGDRSEVLFFELLKKAEAVELAANSLLEPLMDGDVSLTSSGGIERVLHAAKLLAVLHRLNLDFAALPAEQGLHPDFFLDILRQFAVHWRVGDIPPSGAQDYEYLRRDLFLGINVPSYGRHLRRLFPALLREERESLSALLHQPSLPTQLLTFLGLDHADLVAASHATLLDMLRRHPTLGAYHQLLKVNARVAASHLMLTKKFLFKPSRAREVSGTVKLPVVPNDAGTTGMVETLLTTLTLGRKHHELAFLDQISQEEMRSITGIPSEPKVESRDVVNYVRTDAIICA
jgi:hypothetical protein